MQLPFSEHEFFEVFAAYNTTLWPAVAALWGASLVVLLLVLRGSWIDRVASLLLAAHWMWAGIAYHLAFFASINSAAVLFGAMFLVEAVVLAWAGLKPQPIRYAWGRTVPQTIGVALAVYGLAYPFLAMAFVQRYPHTPTYGVPCPTTLFTLGFFFMSAPVLWRIAVIPLVWTVIGGSAAVLFRVVTDFALIAAGVLVLVYMVTHPLWRRSH